MSISLPPLSATLSRSTLPSVGGQLAGSSSSSFDFSSAFPSLYSDDVKNQDFDQNVDVFESKEKNTKDALVLLVDCSKSMNIELPNGETPLKQFLECAISTLKTNVIQSPKDRQGIIFYGSANEKGNHGFSNIYVYHEMSEPSSEPIRQLTALKDEIGQFEKEIGSIDEKDDGEEANFCNALWAAQQMFSESGSDKAGSKRILIFTDKENPNATQPDVQDQAQMRAGDMANLDIEINLIPLGSKQNKFDVTKFYKRIINFVEDGTVDLTAYDAIDSYEELRDVIRLKTIKKRAVVSCPFIIGPDMGIAVKMYCMILEMKPPFAEQLDSVTLDVLDCETKWVCEDTGTLLEDYQISTYIPYGQTKIKISKSEMSQIKSFGDPGLTLIGFKPQDSLKPYYRVKNPYFMYPDEKRIRGSSTAFSALLLAMKKMEKCAICLYVQRKGVVPRFVALVPQLEELDDDGSQIHGPGFHVRFLPYADDIRKIKLPTNPKANDLQIDNAKAVAVSIANIKKEVKEEKVENEEANKSKKEEEFDFFEFNNPVLQNHYTALERLALQAEGPDDEEVDGEEEEKAVDKKDDFKPNVAEMKEKCQEQIDRFLSAMKSEFPDYGKPKEPKAGRKRKVPSGPRAGGPTVKRERAGANVDVGQIDFDTLAKNGQLGRLTMAQLKEYCDRFGLPKSGRKADLVARVQQHLGY